LFVYYWPKLPEVATSVARTGLNRLAMFMFVTLVALLINLALIAYYWQSLPDPMPGLLTPNGSDSAEWSKMTMIMVVSGVPFVIYAGATLLNKFPQYMNYMVQITEENAAREYRNMLNMARYVKAEVMFVLLFVEWTAIQMGLGNAASLPSIFLPVCGAVLAITIGYFVYEMFRLK
jgi:uncharacterized membrane protein